MTAEPIRDYIEVVLRRIAQDKFGQRDAPIVRLSPETTDKGGDGLSGAIEVYVRRRCGAEQEIHREAFGNVRTKQDVDDVFARALSRVLMNHATWPR